MTKNTDAAGQSTAGRPQSHAETLLRAAANGSTNEPDSEHRVEAALEYYNSLACDQNREEEKRKHAAANREMTEKLDALVSGLEFLESRARAIEANRIELLAEVAELAVNSKGPGGGSLAASSELAHRAVRAEVSLALNISEYVVDSQLSLASTLIRHYPAVRLVLESGQISLAHAKVIVEAGSVIGIADDPVTDARRAAYTDAILDHAELETPPRLKPIARRLAETFAETTIDERQAEAAKLSRVYVTDCEDGMADLTAHLPAVQAYAIYDRLTQMGRRVKHANLLNDAEQQGDASLSSESAHEAAKSAAADADRRCLDEIRVDLFSDLLLANEPIMMAGTGVEAIRGRVQVIVQGESLGLGSTLSSEAGSGARSATEAKSSPESSDTGENSDSEEPAFLTRHGPISTRDAQAIAGVADYWDRIKTRPTTGEILTVDRYRPSEHMRRTLAARDLHCRFPGCRAPISRYDIDHTVDAARGGRTATNNLAHLCRGHHVLKHQTAWRVDQLSGGDLKWTSPTGRTRTDRPPSRVYFQKVTHPAPEQVTSDRPPY